MKHIKLFILLLIAYAYVSLAEVTPGSSLAKNTTLSGCQVCATTGDCSHAFRNGPGQFCGHWLDQGNDSQVCCCPNDATCKVSNYSCKCTNNNAATSHPYHFDASGPWIWLGPLLCFLFLLAICGGCYYFCNNRTPRQPELAPVAPIVSDQSTNQATPYQATPYGATPVYGPAPVYGPGYGYGGYGGYGGGGGMGAGTGAALGGAAGLLGGMMLGEALADAGDHGGGWGRGYDGAGGGFDGGGGGGGGDFGGDF